jgi:hypothetical protein
MRAAVTAMMETPIYGLAEAAQYLRVAAQHTSVLGFTVEAPSRH